MKLPFEGYLRHKDSREAADSGLLLWRENFIGFLPFFAVPLWICAFALRMLPGNLQYLSWIILWLLKPLFDRPVLHIISVRFFESGADTKRLFRGLGKSILRGLPGDLLWRRLSPLRSAMMPMRVLEPRKKQRSENKKRTELLKQGGLGYCFLLSFWGIALEIALLVGEFLFFIMISELFFKDLFTFGGDFFRNAEIYFYAAWCLNYMLVETLYVCMGFSLYINSRVEVEGWDIEIMFRGFAEKLRKKALSGAAVIFFIFCLFSPVKAAAADFETAAADSVPIEKLQTILDSPEFGGEKDSWGIRFKKQKEETPDININPIIEKLRVIFAFVLRLILISLIAAFIIILFLFAQKHLRKIKYTAKNYSITSSHGITGDNPAALLEKAVNFFQLGELRMAWGYCAAAAIFSWPHYRSLDFPPNATESDCAAIASGAVTADGDTMADDAASAYSSSAEEARLFCDLIKHWVNFAYAGRLPPEGSFEVAVSFCKMMSKPPAEEADNG